MPAPPDALDDLLDLLDLEPIEHHIFRGRNRPIGSPRVFGGQVLAQSAVAASRTVDPERSIHSLHGYFLRPGDVNQAITFGVERMRDGRSFSARRIHAYQGGKIILSCLASFQIGEDGLDHQEAMPQDIPAPEELPSPVDVLGNLEDPRARRIAFGRPFELRYVTEPIFLEPSPRREAATAVWFKTYSRLPDDPALHRAAIAYASDYTPIEPILRRHGQSWTAPGLNAATLDHAIWWHREARADEWLLYTQSSPNASNARGLACGRIFDRSGRLVATTTQEAMIRLPEQN